MVVLAVTAHSLVDEQVRMREKRVLIKALCQSAHIIVWEERRVNFLSLSSAPKGTMAGSSSSVRCCRDGATSLERQTAG